MGQKIERHDAPFLYRREVSTSVQYKNNSTQTTKN